MECAWTETRAIRFPGPEWSPRIPSSSTGGRTAGHPSGWSIHLRWMGLCNVLNWFWSMNMKKRFSINQIQIILCMVYEIFYIFIKVKILDDVTYFSYRVVSQVGSSLITKQWPFERWTKVFINITYILLCILNLWIHCFEFKCYRS